MVPAQGSLFYVNQSTDDGGLPVPFLEPLDVTTQFFAETVDI